MIDLLAVLPLSLALHGPAHDSLATAPQPRDLAWTSRATFRPIGPDEIVEKYDPIKERVIVGTALFPPVIAPPVTAWRNPPPWARAFDPPLPPLCCGERPRVPPPVPEAPDVPKVPLPASVWMLVVGLALMRASPIWPGLRIRAKRPMQSS